MSKHKSSTLSIANQVVRIDDKQVHKRILAAVFAALITLVSLTQVHTTIIQTRAFLDNYTKDGNIKLNNYINAIDASYKDILTYTPQLPVINRGSYINFNGYMANAMGLRKLNNIVKLNNGHLGEPAASARDVTKDIVQIAKLSEYMKEQGGDFLYVVCPSQFSVNGDELPVGYENFSNDNADAQIDGAQNNDVPVLDLREKMREQGLYPKDVMFITDSHWSVTAGFWGYTQIIERLVNDNAIQSSDTLSALVDLENYNVETLHDVYLGSFGRRTGVYFNGVDNFDIIIPKFDTNLTVTLFPNNTQKTGSFYDICFSSHYDPRKKPSPGSPGGVSEHTYGYWGAAQQGTQYQNTNAPINKRVLMLSDSFGSFPNAFMSLTFTDFAQIYVNRYNWKEGDLEGFISNFDSDIIILLTSTGQDVGKYDFLPSYSFEVK